MSNLECHQNKIVVITGIGKGMGRALVDEFAKRGWLVAGCSRSKDDIKKLQNESDKKNNFQVVDISDNNSVKKWAESVISLYGAPDLLINNASIINKEAPLWKVPAQEFESVMNVNVNGTVNVIRNFVPSMIENKRGIIINISSSWGREGEKGFAPYCASKFAIEGLTQSMAKELPKNMAVVSLNPGEVNTQMLQSCSASYAKTAPTAKQWAEKAISFIVKICPKDNGKALTM